jgi:hypothetical protein
VLIALHAGQPAADMEMADVFQFFEAVFFGKEIAELFEVVLVCYKRMGSVSLLKSKVLDIICKPFVKHSKTRYCKCTKFTVAGTNMFWHNALKRRYQFVIF